MLISWYLPIPNDLSKQSIIVKNEVVKKTVYDETFKNFNAIDTSGFFIKIDYDNKIGDTQDEIPVIIDLAIINSWHYFLILLLMLK